jgi:hypothetical protein
MTTIRESARQYENWLREQLHGDVLDQDLAKKHDKMRKSAFIFLRATYWRWAEMIFDVCPDLVGGTQLLAVGDIHIENYGTWRDVDGRLVWGVNDFDEAAQMPYVLDLVRLATSAMLGRGRRRITDEEICTAILNGYRQGLLAPQPVVLDRDKLWLRELVEVSEQERAKFWKKITAVRGKPAPERYLSAIADALVWGLSARKMRTPWATQDITTSRKAFQSASPLAQEKFGLTMSSYFFGGVPRIGSSHRPDA